MAPENGNATYNFATMDWEAYMAYRPIYPEALYRRIFDHHRSQNGGFDSALDIGGGIGIVAKELLKNFRYVILSDPSELYLDQAKPIFSALGSDRTSFLQRRAEDLRPEDLPHGLVDLITAAESLHWADLNLCMPRILNALKTHGTFAAWMYGIRPVFPSSDSAQPAFYRAYDKLTMLCGKTIPSQTKATPVGIMNARFDSMYFDPTSWMNVRRYYVHPDEVMCAAEFPIADSRVLPESEGQEILTDNALLHHNADYAWIEGYLDNVLPPLNFREAATAELKELKLAMGDRSVTLEWPICLVIATKR